MIILFWIYDIIFILGLLLYLPIYFYRKKITPLALAEKLGFIKRNVCEKSIWIHVVSVGEANLIGTLIKKLNETVNYPIVISTTTLTGNIIAKKKYSQKGEVIFFPFDISFVLSRVIKLINPEIFIAVETEIWPNLFYHLKKKNIPIVIVNGRISNKAFRQYKYVKPFIKRTLDSCNYIGVQNQFYKQRFVSLGCKEEKITISGNMKFESLSFDENRLLEVKNKFTPLLKSNLKILITAASTHHPEEEIILDIYKDLIKTSQNTFLLIAPRHIKRVPAIEKTALSLGFNPVRISKLESPPPEDKNVFILDIIGELIYFYSISDICFVGGSLIKHGGQNILEPIYFLKPTVFGPHMDNFADITEVVLNKGAGIKVTDPQKLKEVFLELIKDTSLRNNLRCKCIEVFQGEKQSLEKNLHLILKCL
ncbi:MAG: 3-deoxy-D-manno-octulosonic acid transferase [Candidatus Omnitrophota bacterium]|nr:MAG: 3-deoxy-D-manno-octulosonic acid transferase [Candidatus Omnitrophota bacterium]